jgi:hypothetical protein
MNPREYVTDAIHRIRAGEVSSEYGSHLAGVFGKAAQQFEEHVRHLLAQVLKASQLSYETELRPHVSGHPPFSKLTLGQTVFCLERLGLSYRGCLPSHLQEGDTLRILCANMASVNRRWVDVKHGKGIDNKDALAHLEMMLACLSLTLACS